MKKLYLSIVFLAVGSAFAQSSSSPSNFKYHDLPNGQRIFVPYNSPLPSAAQQNGAQLWKEAMAYTGTGQVEVSRNTTLPNPVGAPVPATARGRLPAPAVAAAVGRVATAALKTLTPIGIGVALYDLAIELGHSARRSPDGTLEITKSVRTPSGSFDSATIANCAAWGGPDGTKPGVACVEADSSAYMGYPSVGLYKSPNFNTPWSARYVETYTNEIKVIPIKDFTDLIAAKSGWPAASKINDVVLQDPSPDQQVPVDIVASGPASSPGPVSTTNNTTNNTTSKSTTTYNHTYQGDTITTNVSTVNITTNNSTGAVTNNETTTATPPAPPAPPTITCGLPSTPACKLDESGTPASAGTTYDASKTAIDAAKTSAETNIGGAASIAAPAWSFSFALPTGCAPYVTGIKGVVLNVCQYQSTIHGLLSVIWAAATAFAMIGMVGRTIREA